MSKVYIIYSDYPPLNYIIEGVNHPDIQTIRLKRMKGSFIQSCMRGLCLRLGLSWQQRWRYIDSEALEKLADIEKNAKVIIIDSKRKVILRIIHRLLPHSVSKHLFYWTPLRQIFHKHHSEEVRKHIEWIMRMYHVGSFNIEDKNYHPDISVKSVFFRFPESGVDVPSKGQGLYFVGYEKGRVDLLRKYQAEFETLGLSCSFLIYKRKEKGISYRENLKKEMQCQCLVDITVDQTGLSLRPLTALFLGKKLITNNKSIKQYLFYHPDNVFILGEDEMGDLLSFIHAPLHLVSDEIKCSFDINYWALNY